MIIFSDELSVTRDPSYPDVHSPAVRVGNLLTDTSTGKCKNSLSEGRVLIGAPAADRALIGAPAEYRALIGAPADLSS